MKLLYKLIMLMIPVFGCDNTQIQELPEKNQGDRIHDCQCKERFQLSDLGNYDDIVSTQGMAVYFDKYLFQGNNPESQNNNIYVIDIPNKIIIGGFKYRNDSHLNTISCGKKLYHSDKYPLLYISQCYYERGCDVIRLKDDLSGYTTVQFICYRGKNYMIGFNAADWVIDIDNDLIYHYGTKAGHTQIVKFRLPKIGEEKVILTDEDVCHVYNFYHSYIYQGATIINNQIYIPYGYGTEEYPAYLKVFDFTREDIMMHIPLNGYGETESVALFNNNLLIVDNAINPTYRELVF